MNLFPVFGLQAKTCYPKIGAESLINTLNAYILTHSLLIVKRVFISMKALSSSVGGNSDSPDPIGKWQMVVR